MTGLRRVVVTGVGMVSPLGAGVDNSWKRLLNAESGIGTIQGFDASHLPSTIGGEVPIVGGVRSDDPFHCIHNSDNRGTLFDYSAAPVVVGGRRPRGTR